MHDDAAEPVRVAQTRVYVHISLALIEGTATPRLHTQLLLRLDTRTLRVRPLRSVREHVERPRKCEAVIHFKLLHLGVIKLEALYKCGHRVSSLERDLSELVGAS